VAVAERALEATRLSEDGQIAIEALLELVVAQEEAGEFESALRDANELIRRSRAVQANHTTQVVAQVWARADAEIERRQLEAQTAAAVRSAEEDALTRVGNRRLLERLLGRPESAARDLALLMIDIDHFKEVNDTFGHEVGDHVLRALGELLSGDERTGQVVARVGGEEFVFALPSVDIGAATEIAERVRCRIESRPWDELAPGLRVTVSIGVATGPAREWRSVLGDADKALYVAKRGGRNQVKASWAPSLA
jgi:diguanylate cyclase (GGDEF)-like protein